jgi:hypothetical protein
VDGTRTLARLNGRILREFSGRTTSRLRAALPLRIVLPHLEPFLARNLAKEVCKDALVIRRAAEALAAGRRADRDALQELFEATKEVDRAFLARVGTFPFDIVIRYEEIAPVRMQRIELLLDAAYRILDAWRGEARLRAAVQAAYPRPDLERLLADLLRLYVDETRVLSRSVRLPALLLPLRDKVASNLVAIMCEVAARLARDLARENDATIHAHRPDFPLRS